ncbi:MAG: site-2 protease family protein [Actinomycetota bacterium]|nr:site-2 protease family protein [Actinomycetota bacterium]
MNANSGIKLGKIFGIDITLDYSWFLIFGIVAFGLTFALFPQLVPGLNITIYAAMGVITSLLFFTSVLFHELMHSIVAKRYGMNIEGIKLLVFGGVSQLTEEPHSPKVEFWMAIAGPLGSLFLGGFFIAVFLLGRWIGIEQLLVVPAFWLGYINIVLGVFNLLPGFPLDGGRVLRSAVWYFTGNLKHATGIATGFGKGLAYLMILAGIVGPFFNNISFLWFILLGWYLLRAAESSYQQIIFQEAVEGIRVGQAMTQNPETVMPDINIDEMVKEHFMKHHWIAYPVVEDNRVKGMITIDNIKDIPRRSWKRKHVRDVMRPLSADFVTTPDSWISDILPKLNTKAGGRMLVVKGGRLLGILTKLDVTRAAIKRLRLEEEQRRSAA